MLAVCLAGCGTIVCSAYLMRRAQLVRNLKIRFDCEAGPPRRRDWHTVAVIFRDHDGAPASQPFASPELAARILNSESSWQGCWNSDPESLVAAIVVRMMHWQSELKSSQVYLSNFKLPVILKSGSHFSVAHHRKRYSLSSCQTILS